MTRFFIFHHPFNNTSIQWPDSNMSKGIADNFGDILGLNRIDYHIGKSEVRIGTFASIFGANSFFKLSFHFLFVPESLACQQLVNCDGPKKTIIRLSAAVQRVFRL
jgi:hypothetical protein